MEDLGTERAYQESQQISTMHKQALSNLDELVKVEARIEKVLALHRSVFTKRPKCVWCETNYPCQTVRILKGQDDDRA